MEDDCGYDPYDDREDVEKDEDHECPYCTHKCNFCLDLNDRDFF
jgi:hypothetical protein